MIDEFTGTEIRSIAEAPRDGSVILGRANRGSTYIKAQWGGDAWIYGGGGAREVCDPQPEEWLKDPQDD